MGGWLAKANVTVDKHAIHVEKDAVQVNLNVSSFLKYSFHEVRYKSSQIPIIKLQYLLKVFPAFFGKCWNLSYVRHFPKYAVSSFKKCCNL